MQTLLRSVPQALRPATQGSPRYVDRKRLIVLCDGTWRDSNVTDKFDYPTNVTRFARALSANHHEQISDGSVREVPQIVFYQAGVGTTDGTRLRGGLYGAGLSANVRAVYSFLAHNYEVGDEIFFFGFSRGAYTARSVAGLVASLGLLTKSGMDHFPVVYNRYYSHAATLSSKPDLPSFDVSNANFISSLTKKGLIQTSARHAIKIIGVWDTVGFHGDEADGEKIEFHNLTLSPLVENAYHAISLDERRGPYSPTLWELPDAKTIQRAFPKEPPPFKQDVQQVWFSGRHSDIGGGLDDPRLSDIALGWMIAQCAKGDKLSFIDLEPSTEKSGPDGKDWGYLLKPELPESSAAADWLTSKGEANEPDLFDSVTATFTGQDRAPLTLKGKTNEMIHESVRNRDFKKWKCPALKNGEKDADGGYLVKGGGKGSLKVAPRVVDEGGKGELELFFKGRVKKIVEDPELTAVKN